MRVYVYYNLHKHCFSVRAVDGEQRGRVIAHAAAVRLADVRFRVSEAGRQRVLREQRKNVHAGVVGELTNLVLHGAEPDQAWLDCLAQFEKDATAVTYNPYANDSFVERVTGTCVHSARECVLRGKGALALL
jgi:hypothetical protein